MKFYISNFFSDIGGSLGLWLGFGIAQVFIATRRIAIKEAQQILNCWIFEKELYFQVIDLLCKTPIPALSKLFGDKNIQGQD